MQKAEFPRVGFVRLQLFVSHTVALGGFKLRCMLS